MRVKQIRIVLPARMRASSAAEARLIAETIGKSLADAQAGANLPTIHVQASGRSAHHMRQDIATAVTSASAGIRKGSW